MMLFSGSNTTSLAWESAKALGVELGKTKIKKFPDQEIYVKLESNPSGSDCAVISSIASSEDFVELLLLLECLRDHGARQIHCVCPYLSYMRQDKRFTEGESLSAKTVLKILDEYSDELTTINCHFLSSRGDSFFNGVKFHNLDAIPKLVKHFQPKLKNPLVVAPDAGSLNYAKSAAQILDCEFNHLTKKRLSGTQVVIKEKSLDVAGKDVLMLDDIISTGGTIREAAKIIKGWNPSSVNVGCVHGLFLSGLEGFRGAADAIISTNTLASNASKVSVASLIASHLSQKRNG